MHVHVICSDGEAKFWLEPKIKLAHNIHLSRVQLRVIEEMIYENYNEIAATWKLFFGR